MNQASANVLVRIIMISSDLLVNTSDLPDTIKNMYVSGWIVHMLEYDDSIISEQNEQCEANEVWFNVDEISEYWNIGSP